MTARRIGHSGFKARDAVHACVRAWERGEERRLLCRPLHITYSTQPAWLLACLPTSSCCFRSSAPCVLAACCVADIIPSCVDRYQQQQTHSRGVVHMQSEWGGGRERVDANSTQNRHPANTEVRMEESSVP